MNTLKQQILTRAHELGFLLAGVTDCSPPESFSRYQDWVAQGYHGEMHYLATERNLQRRAEPRRILPDCQSILLLGLPYQPPPASPPADPLRGQVAAYACAPDYHKALRQPLRDLVAFIRQAANLAPEQRLLYYTDTGAILERDLAQRAGLGWIGKSGMLIHPRAGSYFLLAEIFLPLALPPDPPFPTDHCGTCTRCLDACPTQAILPGQRTIDARRCISYLTIELREAIPEALRPQVGNWVFGCDVCQQVCPWNRFARPPAAETPLPPRSDLAQPQLLDEWRTLPDEAAFARRFRDTPLWRSKRRGYLRNVLVALGNSGNQAARPLLAEAAADADPLLREHALWALAQLDGGKNS